MVEPVRAHPSRRSPAMLVLALGIACALAACSSAGTEAPESTEAAPTSNPKATEAAPTQEATPEATAASEYTVEQQNAIESAQSYLDLSGFSRQKLIEQLVFEGHSEDDATSAVDSLDADWNAEAVESAQSYLDISSFSRAKLIEQLEFEGYTHDEAVFGVDSTGL